MRDAIANNWTEKYRPENFKNIQGNNKALDHIRKWAANWSPGDRAQLLVGEPGTGKTTTAIVVSETLDYPLNQINASEARTTDDIKWMARSMRSTPANEEHQLVLLDEVDSWHHAANKTPLYEALENPANPIILTANEDWNIPDAIKSRCKTHKFKLNVGSRRAKLREIAEAEGLELDKQDLNKLAGRPDLRSAINDLQNWSGSDLPPSEDHRTWSRGEFSSVEALLSGNRKIFRDALGPGDNSFRDLESAIYWIDENLTTEWRGLEAGVGYDVLSRADRRVRQGYDTQARGFPYAGALLQMLPETRLSKPYQGWISVDFPNWFRSSQRRYDEETAEGHLYRALKGERGYRIACSYHEFLTDYLPILKSLSKDERMELALDHRVPEDGLEALDISPDDFDDWRGYAEEGDGWRPNAQSAADW